MQIQYCCIDVKYIIYVARHINSIVIDLYSVFSDFPKTVGPSVLTDRNAVGPTISKYISDRMSDKT